MPAPTWRQRGGGWQENASENTGHHTAVRVEPASRDGSRMLTPRLQEGHRAWPCSLPSQHPRCPHPVCAPPTQFRTKPTQRRSAPTRSTRLFRLTLTATTTAPPTATPATVAAALAAAATPASAPAPVTPVAAGPPSRGVTVFADRNLTAVQLGVVQRANRLLRLLAGAVFQDAHALAAPAALGGGVGARCERHS
jgi:hypothetical protein